MLVLLAFWSVAIGMLIFIIDVIRRLTRAAELGAEARMRQAKAIEALSKRNDMSPQLPKEDLR